MPRLRVRIPVEVELEPEQMEAVEAFAGVVRTVRESGTVDAVARLLDAVKSAAKAPARRQARR